MNNIVFIEGVSGVGKTTTTRLLRDKLLDMGYNAGCHLEGDPDNPLDPFKGTYPPVIPLTVFSETYMQCWQNFMENQFKKDFILILDGTLFHHQINDLIREYDAADEVIANHILKLLEMIQQANPIVFYLFSNDVGKSLIQARISRKQSLPAEERIAYWENRKRVDLYVLERLSAESHAQNIDDGWSAMFETVIKLINTERV